MRYNCLHRHRTSGDVPNVRLPKDYPWEVFGRLLADLRGSLTEDEYQAALLVARKRDFEMYQDLVSRWGLQSLASAGGTHNPDWVAKYQLSRLLAKYQFPASASMRTAVATEKFVAADRACRHYNRTRGKFLQRSLDAWNDEGNTMTSLPKEIRRSEISVLIWAKRFVTQVLGSTLPEFDTLTQDARHGPGSTLATTKGQVSTYYKYSQWPYTVTTRCAPHARKLIESDPRWLGAIEDSYRRKNNIPAWRILDRETFWSSIFDLSDYNRVCFVPKDSRTDRPIAIEPTLNLMLQLGVDGFIRRRLKPHGIDLDSQEKNQYLAGAGSVNVGVGVTRYSTIDLASASDSVSLRICKILLPHPWWKYLFDLRSPKGRLPDGTIVRYRKISSMGNGYTFALESLIFAALCFGVAKTLLGSYPKDQIAVFGDDLVVPEQIALETVHWLEWFGFTVNVTKSFLFGTVKESCGTDWVQGHPVRPVHMKSHPSSLADVITDRNRLARWLEVRMGILSEDSQLLSWYEKYLTAAPRGPLSDEDFSSYVHTKTPGLCRRYLYRWNSLVQVPLDQDGPEFFFRKLMHPLKGQGSSGARPLSSKWLPDGRVESGNSFLVHRRNASRWKMARSVASYWQQEYEDRRYQFVSNP